MIIFLYGIDSYRSRQQLNKYKEKFLKDTGNADGGVIFLDGEKLTLDKLNEQGSTSSLFAEKRMLVVERIFSNKGTKTLFDIAVFLQKKAEKSDNVYLFWDDITGEKMGRSKLFKYLSNLQTAEKFINLTNTEVVTWLKKQVAIEGLTVSAQAGNMLNAYFENNLWLLKNEIEKLIHYKLANQKDDNDLEIGVKEVELLCRGKSHENIFALTDAISVKNKKLALELFDKEIENGTDGIYLLTMIVRQFKILLQIKDAMERGMNINEIKNKFRMHPYVIEKTSGQARNFTVATLVGINDALLRIEKAIKTGQADPQLALSVLISRI